MRQSDGSNAGIQRSLALPRLLASDLLREIPGSIAGMAASKGYPLPLRAHPFPSRLPGGR